VELFLIDLFLDDRFGNFGIGVHVLAKLSLIIEALA